ncbi:TPA: hypothetical protein ACKPYB_002136 [Stenotrophomonas maltophilia]|uniref:hypothetical protein n=1 Tax=Stenotrophomonas TaxID=40323 RepID=UPI001AA106DD|nr:MULTISPECIES: hypothetical protein [Stenotrophomonas]ELF4109699.1 hypothetical protein [Stenotrophomonas maltophilia]MBO1744268.1 hypothetical protein [Stenotrophomonas maltophilia]MCU1175702.1 hypothetical protein [Stenotrophomonas maltophilia]WAP03260.1 hypothetical protein FQS62_007120 [Stenotrophomonas sp. SBJS02]HEA4090702.1 hypothetical protein [Stenotrophomonas maltophilia]
MVWIYWVQLWHLIWVRLERAEHRRSGEGEEARVSERSEFPRRPSTGRGAQGTGAQHRLATWRRVSLVTFFARAKKVTPMNNEAPSARATRKTPTPQPF